MCAAEKFAAQLSSGGGALGYARGLHDIGSILHGVIVAFPLSASVLSNRRARVGSPQVVGAIATSIVEALPLIASLLGTVSSDR